MTDKKYTDEEIIKALEYCNADISKCDRCVLQRDCESNPFYSAVAEHALDLINRQKAEIERLKGSTIVNSIVERQRIKREAKTEAYKEFADMVKKNIKEVWNYNNGTCSCVLILTKDIDNFLKEMLGEEE